MKIHHTPDPRLNFEPILSPWTIIWKAIDHDSRNGYRAEAIVRETQFQSHWRTNARHLTNDRKPLYIYTMADQNNGLPSKILRNA